MLAHERRKHHIRQKRKQHGHHIELGEGAFHVQCLLVLYCCIRDIVVLWQAWFKVAWLQDKKRTRYKACIWILNVFTLDFFRRVLQFEGSEKENDEWTHRKVFTVEFEVLPHANKQVQVQLVQQQMYRHVSLLARLQKIAKQLHVTEAVHHYSQGL